MSQNGPSSRNALHRLLLVLAVFVGVMVYAYGWRVTDIGLEETQDPTRQESVQRALRELLSPDIFEQEHASQFVEASFRRGCPEDGEAVQQPGRQPGEPYVVLSPACGTSGDPVTVEGFNFVPNAVAFLRWVPPTGQRRPLVRVDIDPTGYFRTEVEVPRIRGSEGEVHTVEVEETVPVGLPYLSETTLTVVEKMIETIFLALMATTLAVPIAAVLSFFAARNLMRQMRMPLGNVLVGFVLLPLGWLLGSLLLGPVGELGVRWGRQVLAGIAPAVAAVVVYGLFSQAAYRMELSIGSFAYQVRSILLNILLLVVGVFILGVLGGLGVWLGEQLQAGLLADLGNFVGTLGRLIELLVSTLAALGGAIFAASVAMNLTRPALRHIAPLPGHVLGGLLGVLGGALLMALFALFANQAALLGLLPPLIAGVLGMQIAHMAYSRLFGLGRQKYDVSDFHQTARTVVAGVGAVLVFAVVYGYLDTSRAIVDGRIPSSVPYQTTLFGVPISLQYYVLQAGIVGAVLGGVGGLLAGTHATFPLGLAIYNTTRTVLNALRSIEPLIMGIVFVIWVGIGPFAGVLALTLHSIAALGKLYSEQTESIDPGPVEAIQATGANQLQTIIYGVVPQIIPPYIAFTIYRWDINVRMSTIIGFVGGGGIGFLLQQQINLLRYRDAGVAVLAIAIVVSVLDYASASIRERIV